MLDGNVAPVLFPILANSAHAMRTDRNHLFSPSSVCTSLANLLQISLRQFAEQIIIAQPPHRIAAALFLPQHSECNSQVIQDLNQGQQNLSSIRIERSQASHPQAVLRGSSK